jgi:branched-chain amino acid transport system permease protein
MEVLLSGQLLVAMLVLASLYALIATGLNLVYGTMRLLNVAHGEIVMLGGYVAYWGTTRLGIGPIGSIPVAMLLTAALGAVVYLGLFRRLLHSRSLAKRVEANSLLVFFGVSIVVQNLTALAFTANARSYVYLEDIVRLGNVSVTANRLVTLAIAAGACLAVALFFRLTRMGLAIRALIQQRDAAALVGIDASRTNLGVFALGFALAGLAGTLVSMSEQISPFIGFPYTISAFVIIILGGLGNVFGGLVGALILSAVEVYGVALTSVLVYGVFILILLIRPEGLLGRAIAPR